MRPRPSRPVRGRAPGFGPLPAWVIWSAVLLLDLAMILLVLTALVWAGDRIEDVIWPGGTEWLEF